LTTTPSCIKAIFSVTYISGSDGEIDPLCTKARDAVKKAY